MFATEAFVEHERDYVLDRIGDPALLSEHPAGEPPLTTLAGVATSTNTIHHAFHLLRFEEVTGRRLREHATVVEWGAGYGNLCKLLLRLHGGEPTLVLVDTPLFSAIQHHYLSAVLGPDRVVLHARGPVAVHPGRVNVVPVGLAGDLDVAADLFVSTWALNESARAAQDLVVGRDFYGARSLLLAMHGSDPLAARLLARGARAVPVRSPLPDQHYYVA